MQWGLVFSPAEYELAARALGAPIPQNDAERAAAAPMVAMVLREFGRGGTPPPPGMDNQGMQNTGATHSLNGYPDNNHPMERQYLASRMRTDATPELDPEILQLLEMVGDQPGAVDAIMHLLSYIQQNQNQHMDQLSSQRPAECDYPNLGDNYSMLNAPGSNMIPPSVQFQQLS